LSFGVWGLGFGVWGLGFRIRGVGFWGVGREGFSVASAHKKLSQPSTLQSRKAPFNNSSRLKGNARLRWQ
jgi:hypothetical protein